MAHEVFESELDLDALDALDEVESPAKPARVEAEGVDVEVVDDTPAQDRNRSPLPKEVTDALEEDSDVEEYSAKVKQRIDQMKKAWHDERRAKEAAARERDEAVRIAQTAYQTQVAYQQRLQEGEAWAIEQAKQRSALTLENAKRDYRDAYESGDADKMVDAQQALSMATMEADRFNQYRPQYSFNQPALQQQQSAVQMRSQPTEEAYTPPKPDSRTQEWGDRNTWFGEDDEMTSFALGVHKTLERAGVAPNSEEYFERIDARMREVFPDKFGMTKRQSSTVVAPVGRSPKGKKVVLTQTQVALAKRLGITPEAYARELVKQQEK